MRKKEDPINEHLAGLRKTRAMFKRHNRHILITSLFNAFIFATLILLFMLNDIVMFSISLISFGINCINIGSMSNAKKDYERAIKFHKINLNRLGYNDENWN